MRGRRSPVVMQPTIGPTGPVDVVRATCRSYADPRTTMPPCGRRRSTGATTTLVAMDTEFSTDGIVTTQRLTKTYGRRTAVDAVSLTVRRGEVYGFLGPNGAGKTTTLRMLMGLVRASGGSARVLGGSPGDPAVLRRVGALIEGPGFYPYLSGRDNLRVLARYNRQPDREVE